MKSGYSVWTIASHRSSRVLLGDARRRRRRRLAPPDEPSTWLQVAIDVVVEQVGSTTGVGPRLSVAARPTRRARRMRRRRVQDRVDGDSTPRRTLSAPPSLSTCSSRQPRMVATSSGRCFRCSASVSASRIACSRKADAMTACWEIASAKIGRSEARSLTLPPKSFMPGADQKKGCRASSSSSRGATPVSPRTWPRAASAHLGAQRRDLGKSSKTCGTSCWKPVRLSGFAAAAARGRPPSATPPGASSASRRTRATCPSAPRATR